jgi:hypothetical protein
VAKRGDALCRNEKRKECSCGNYKRSDYDRNRRHSRATPNAATAAAAQTVAANGSENGAGRTLAGIIAAIAAMAA